MSAQGRLATDAKKADALSYTAESIRNMSMGRPGLFLFHLEFLLPLQFIELKIKSA